jgi:hypothetical protein
MVTVRLNSRMTILPRRRWADVAELRASYCDRFLTAWRTPSQTREGAVLLIEPDGMFPVCVPIHKCMNCADRGRSLYNDIKLSCKRAFVMMGQVG